MKPDWTHATLAELTEPVAKVDPKNKLQATDITYVDLSAIDRDLKRISRASILPATEAPSRARQLLRRGDVLVSTVRPNLNAVATVGPELDGAIASTGFTVLRPKSELDGHYLFHWVTTKAFVRSLVQQATGASYPAVSDKIVKAAQIPLPPLAEQQRLASVLDTADRLRKRAITPLQVLDKLGDAMFVTLHSSQESSQWPSTRIGDIARVVRGASPRPAGDPRFFGGDIPWLKISDVTATAGMTVTKIKDTVTADGAKRSVRVPAHTLILTNSATVGIPRFLGLETCIHDGFIAFLDIDEAQIDPRFLYATLLHRRDQIMRLAPEGTQKNLNTPIVKAIQLQLPPISLQKAYGDRIDRTEAHAALCNRRLDSLEDLFASLRYRAFSGKL